MAAQAVRHSRLGIWPMLLLFGVLLVSLSLMSDATHNSERFGQLYSWLLLLNALGLVVLTGLIGSNLYWLVSQYRARAPGARLTSRLVVTFVILAVVPISIVYYFSLQFLQRGIDTWFDVQIEEALDDALELSRGALDVRLNDLLKITEKIAEEVSDMTPATIPIGLYDLRVLSGAVELSVFGLDNRIVASSTSEGSNIVPSRPGGHALMSLAQGRSYVGLDPVGDSGLYVRAVVPVQVSKSGVEPLTLQALYRIPERLSRLADNVEDQVVRYRKLAYLRKPLKYSYILTLSLVLVLSLLSAVWAAFYSARRMVEPIGILAEGTRAVAEGDYSRRLPVTSEDELGFLVRLFNDMTRRLSKARDQAHSSQQEVEGQRAYLETVLGSLSSGVLSISTYGELRTVNEAACQILGIDLSGQLGHTLDTIAERYAFLEPLFSLVRKHYEEGVQDWEEQVELFDSAGRRVLLCRSTALPVSDESSGGQVLVFDDVTDLIRAQRDAAWGDVARRLAHEIKNPLTPIQLSAERLRRKYLAGMSGKEAEVMDRATRTIVQQVETLKEMVNAFSDYARAPMLQLEPVDLYELLRDVADLYKGSRLHIQLDLVEPVPMLNGDAGRLRQLLHNLFRNALEAVRQQPRGELLVKSRWILDAGERYIGLSFEDNGSGFSDEVLERLFEPYVTTKTRGTGLGLAIVKKIVEEHNGQIRAQNTPQHHACIELQFHAETQKALS
ncbi:MAG TPA: HAMP domain-containing protein [Gammaproteobacteria bacterium]|nr:HAMP domain-containing protein [Gammaproteobacteria bacterium]